VVDERPIRLPVGAGLLFYIQAAVADSMNMDNATRHAMMVHLRSSGVTG
jgi:hypothetical protein